MTDNRLSPIRYVEIGISDPARSLAFYCDLLGFRPLHGVPGRVSEREHWLSAGPALIKLVDVGPGDLGGWTNANLQQGLRHIGWKVGNVELQSERLREAGVEFAIEPLEAPGGVWISFFYDPDGTLLEFVDRYVQYHRVLSPELAERDRVAAKGRSRTAGPVFDHVAATVDDLDRSLAFYRDNFGYEPIGQLDLGGDNGCVITYLDAGGVGLELISYSAPTSPNPWTPEEPRLGLRTIGIGIGDAAAGQRLVMDPDGTPLQLTGGN